MNCSRHYANWPLKTVLGKIVYWWLFQCIGPPLRPRSTKPPLSPTSSSPGLQVSLLDRWYSITDDIRIGMMRSRIFHFLKQLLGKKNSSDKKKKNKKIITRDMISEPTGFKHVQGNPCYGPWQWGNGIILCMTDSSLLILLLWWFLAGVYWLLSLVLPDPMCTILIYIYAVFERHHMYGDCTFNLVKLSLTALSHKWCLKMRPHISIRGFVRPSVGRLIGR